MKKLRAGKPAKSTPHHQQVNGNLMPLFYDRIGTVSMFTEDWQESIWWSLGCGSGWKLEIGDWRLVLSKVEGLEVGNRSAEGECDKNENRREEFHRGDSSIAGKGCQAIYEDEWTGTTSHSSRGNYAIWSHRQLARIMVKPKYHQFPSSGLGH